MLERAVRTPRMTWLWTSVLVAILAISCEAASESKTEATEVESPAAPDTATIEGRIAVPLGYKRVRAAPGSFGAWLRGLRLRPGRPPVHLYDGRLKSNQDAHYAVVDIDVGSVDLQQCADAIIRLRAEYLFSASCQDEIRFKFTSGDDAPWADWRRGLRPKVDGNAVSWRNTASADSSHANLRRYLDVVFTYAGSSSLSRELLKVADPARPEIGDVFIVGGFPGHAVLVVDVAENPEGKRIFLLAQSYMPAQDIHILRSPEGFSPWYSARQTGTLNTPEWVFSYADLRRFARVDCPHPARTERRQ